MLEHALVKGTKLNDRYIVDGVIGSGGFGITYVAFDLLLNSMVAIKEFFVAGCMERDANNKKAVILPENGQAFEKVERSKMHFLREIEIMKAIQNVPYISRIRDDFYENGTYYIVMNLLHGKSLEAYRKENSRPMKTAELLEPLEHVLSALYEMHALGIIHRDISPGNLFLTEGGDLYLIDFGTATSLDTKSKLWNGDFFEHKGFQAPEYREVKMQGAWTDIYSLCATVVYLLTGDAVPLPEERMQFDEVPSMLLRRGLSTRQQNALMHGLNLDIQARCDSALELLQEFGSAQIKESFIGDSATKEAKYCACTSVGSRKINQDNLIVDGLFYFEGTDFTKSGSIETSPDEIHLVAVCDGVGGARSGELASRAVVQALNHFLTQQRKSETIPERLLPELLDQMNEKIISLSKKIGQTGTTLSLLLWKGNQYYIVNIGDSPVFLLRKRKLTQLSAAQTMAAKKEMMGDTILLSDRHTLVNYLGRDAIAGSQMMAYRHGYLKKGDTFLLCSDGISNKIDKDRLKRFLGKSEKGAIQAMYRVISRCINNDNCSAIVVKF